MSNQQGFKARANIDIAPVCPDSVQQRRRQASVSPRPLQTRVCYVATHQLCFCQVCRRPCKRICFSIVCLARVDGIAVSSHHAVKGHQLMGPPLCDMTCSRDA